MSSRRKKSRFTKTDVNTICEMQRKIDAYESYIMGICGFSNPKHSSQKYVVILMKTEMDEWVSLAWENIRKMKDDLERLKSDNI